LAHWWDLVAALLVCVCAGWPIGYFVDSCWARLGWQKGGTDSTRLPWLVGLVGLVERCLFLLALSVGQPAFLGLWLTLKVAAQWKHWNDPEVEVGEATVPGRAIFQVFLLGNALSIYFAFAAFWVMSWLRMGNVFLPVLVVSASSIAVLTLSVAVAYPGRGRRAPAGGR